MRRHLNVSKTKSIVVLSIICVFIALMIVFAVVDFPIGKSVYDYHGYAKTISLGMDLSGGIEAVYRVTDDGIGNLDQRINGTVSSLQSLLIDKGIDINAQDINGESALSCAVNYTKNTNLILLLQLSLVTHSCLTPCDPMDCST